MLPKEVLEDIECNIESFSAPCSRGRVSTNRGELRQLGRLDACIIKSTAV